MSKKYPRNDFERRWVLTDGHAGVDNDSADVTLAGKSSQIRGPTSGKVTPVADSYQPDVTGGITYRRLVPTQRSDRQSGWSVISLSIAHWDCLKIYVAEFDVRSSLSGLRGGPSLCHRRRVATTT